jgi:hypothetical protein
MAQWFGESEPEIDELRYLAFTDDAQGLQCYEQLHDLPHDPQSEQELVADYNAISRASCVVRWCARGCAPS